MRRMSLERLLHRAAREGPRKSPNCLSRARILQMTGWNTLDLIEYRCPDTSDLLRKHGGKTAEELKAASKPTNPLLKLQHQNRRQPAPSISIHDAVLKENIEAVNRT